MMTTGGKQRRPDQPGRRSLRRAGALATGAVLTGTVLLGGAPAAPAAPLAAPLAVPATAHYELTALNSGWDEFLRFMLNYVFFIGNKTLPELVTNPFTGQSASVGEVLGWLNLAPNDPLSDVFTDLGLQNFTINSILADSGLPEGATVDEAMAHWGLADLTLNQLLSGLGVGSASTIAELVDQMGLGANTLSDVLSELGVPTSTTTMGDLFGALGGYGLAGFLPLFGLGRDSTVGDALGGAGIDPEQTLNNFLGLSGFADFIGSLTVGKLLDFTPDTTLADVVGALDWTVDGAKTVLGEVSLDDLLLQLHLNPNEPLDELLSGLQIGPEPTDTLGSQSILQAMDWMLNLDQTAVPVPPGVLDSTQIGDYLIGIGLGELTLNQWLGFDPVI